jgi:Cu/Ag efflux pump CusA
VLLHDAGRRRQTVTCNVEGRDIASFVAEAKSRIGREVELPKGTYVAFAGAAEERERGQRELLLHSGLASIGVLLLLGMALHRGRNLVLVLVNLPFALVGAARRVDRRRHARSARSSAFDPLSGSRRGTRS